MNLKTSLKLKETIKFSRMS